VKTSSAKAKGRRLSSEIKEVLHKIFPELEPADILVTPSGMTGPDLSFSPHAQRILGFYTECKNQESIAIWSALQQAASYTKEGHQGILFFARNRTPPHVAMPLSHFLKLLRESYDYRKTKTNLEGDHVRSLQQPVVEANHPKLLREDREEFADLRFDPMAICKRLGDEP